jgi:Polysaccharide lyase/Putative Ig domain
LGRGAIALVFAAAWLVAASLPFAKSSDGEIVFDGTWEGADPASAWREIHVSYGGGTYEFVKDSQRRGTVARVTLPSGGDAAIEAIHHSPLNLGRTTVYGLAFKFPRDWRVPSEGWGCLIAQLGYPLLKYTNIGLGVGRDYVGLEMHTGRIDWHGRTPSAQAPATFDLYRRYTDPKNYIIPRSRFKTGVWHLLVIQIKWATDSSGSLRAWHQMQGEVNWTETIDFEHIPTMQWGYGITGAYMSSVGKDAQGEPREVSDKVGAYRYDGSTPFKVFNDGLLIGTQTDAVAARLRGTSFTPVVRRSPVGTIVSGHPYRASLVASGGVRPLTWSITRGSLPPGLRFSARNGTVSGRTSARPGRWRVVFSVRDARGVRAVRAVTLRVVR